MECPQISVVLPIFNAERYVAGAIRSVLSQSEKNIEVIAIDDGSTDGSLNVVRAASHEDSRVVLRARENRGLIATLNEGVLLAKAPLIARMDADDVCLPGRLAKQRAYLDANADCVAVGCHVFEIDEAGRPIGEWRRPIAHEQIDEAHLLHAAGIVHPSVMFRRDTVRAVGGYDARWRRVEDLDLFLRMAEIGRLANLNEVLLLYRRHMQSVTLLHRDEQDRLKWEVQSEARRRRGRRDEVCKPVAWPAERVAEAMMQKAYRNEFYPTAFHFALRLLRGTPMRRDLWAVAAKAAVKNLMGQTRHFDPASGTVA